MTDHPDVDKWWKHRRRMAYTGLVWGILQTPAWAGVIVYFGAEGLGPVISWSYALSVALIMSYFGNTSVETWVNKR